MSKWQSIETAPAGYDGKKFHDVLFRGVSSSGTLARPVYVSGWMDRDRKPVHNYHYKLTITHWMPLPDPPND